MLKHSFSLLLLSVFLFAACRKEIIETPTILANSVVQPEGDVTRTVLVALTLNVPSAKEVRVDYATTNGTAFAGQDYTAAAGTLVFAPGEMTQTISLSIQGDQTYEPDERFTVQFSNAVNLSLTIGAVGINLSNDDPFIPAGGYATPLAYAGKSLVWSDEFDGSTLDTDAWTFEIGNGSWGWGNNELEYYRRENTRLINGYMVIEARRENALNFQYTSSRLLTKGKREFQYGRIDIRAALPFGQGIWPALWMLGDNIDQVGWPACGEIDIMELVGHEPGKMYGTAHYGPDLAQHASKGAFVSLAAGEKFGDKFHVFSIEWVENNIKWYMDDQLFFEFSKADAGLDAYPFNHAHFLLINLAVGGNWPGNPDNSTVFPQQLVVDYVRVFQ